MASINYSYFISSHSARRRPAITRELTKRAYAMKDTISLAEGMPNDQQFPFEKIEITMKDGSNIRLEGQQLNTSLQYLPTQGYPPLVKTLKEFTKQVHQPPNWENYELMVTNGSQDGISKCLELCIQEGDPVLVPNPLYNGVEVVLKPYKAELLGIDTDQHGISASKLTKILEERKAKYTEEGGGMPKILYVNPTGANPDGSTMSVERKREIYEICCKYNILIIEDDPYFFVHFLEETPASFLSMDVEGRVIRLDSLSKVIVENLLQTWGLERFMEHADFVRNYYKARRDLALEATERHLKGLCEWTVPTGGMFLWLKVNGVSDVHEMLMTRGLKKGITFVPGHAFMADPTKACNLIRASFSRVPPKQLDKAMRLLAELIREEHLLLRRKLDNFT